MRIWELWQISDKKYTKQQQFGAKLTAINAQSQIMNATMTWGPMGVEWGVDNERWHYFNDISTGMPKICHYRATLYFPSGLSEPSKTEGVISITADEEIVKPTGQYNVDWSKKVSTDALTKGLSRLGFNADIFLGDWDDNKYVANQDSSPAKASKKQSSATKVTPNPYSLSNVTSNPQSIQDEI